MDDQDGWKIVESCRQEANGPAWTAFVDRFEPSLLKGIRRALRGLGFRGNPADVTADLLQETYCKILARERRVLGLCRERDARALDAFFAQLADRTTRDSFRALWAEKRGHDLLTPWNQVIESRIAERAASSPEARLLLIEARDRLLEKCRRAAGVKQPERNFRVLALAFVEGLSSREIAQRFAGRLSRTCIDSLVYRARRRLIKEGGELGPRRALA